MRKALFLELPSVGFKNFQALMRAYDQAQESVYFIQVGANDGKILDPIHVLVKSLHWGGILVEAQKEVFNSELLAAYADVDNLVFENVAIAAQAGARPLYKLTCSNKRWATGLASFDRAHVEKHIRSGYVQKMMKSADSSVHADMDDWIGFETVKCISFNQLLDRHKPQKVDLLQIDVEGYDYELLKSLDFDRCAPAVIQYEGFHLSLEDELSCVNMLAVQGYDLFWAGLNRVAVRSEVLDQLRK